MLYTNSLPVMFSERYDIFVAAYKKKWCLDGHKKGLFELEWWAVSFFCGCSALPYSTRAISV